MSLCEFEWIDEGAALARCRNCDDRRKLRSLNTRRACRANPKQGLRQNPKSDNAGCLHRGDVLRVEDCATCQGKIELPVYQCAVHGECTLENHARRNPALAGVHVCRGCPNAKLEASGEPALPGLLTRAKNFAGAVARDLRNGRKRRSAALIQKIFDQHCRVCPLFNATEHACSKCGCPVSNSDPEANKLAWASESCPDGRWPIQRANLIYYILPLRHPENVWQWNVEQLRRRLEIFNGRRIVTIATRGPGERLSLDPPERVIEAFGDDAAHIEFHTRHNDQHYWETPAFRAMLFALYSGLPIEEADRKMSGQKNEENIFLSSNLSVSPSEATFYAHAKGVRRAIQTAVRPWTQAMYEHNLDRWPEVREILSVYPCCGIAKQRSRPFNLGDATDDAHNWHFAGTFFWLNNAALFRTVGVSPAPNAFSIPDHSHAVEGYLATQFTRDEAYCLAFENPGKVYTASTWARTAQARDDTLVEERATATGEPPTVFVLGHEPGKLAAVRHAPHLRKIHLASLRQDARLAENQIYLADTLLDCPAAYIGVASVSWNQKYAGREWKGRTWPTCLPVERLDELPLTAGVVWAAALNDDPRCVAGLGEVVTGLLPLVDEALAAVGASSRHDGPGGLLASNFVAHRDVVRDLVHWMRATLGALIAKYGDGRDWPLSTAADLGDRLPAFVGEALSILYFAGRTDLELKQIPPP